MKKFVPALILVALALSFGVASAQPPGPNVGWVHGNCDNGLVFDLWLGRAPNANAGHLEDGRIVHLRSLYIQLQDGTWFTAFIVPGKGVDRIWCNMTASFRPEPLRGEIDIDPPG
jgi:hypothetical protein